MNEKRKTEIKPLGMRVYSLHAGDLAYLGGGGVQEHLKSNPSVVDI